MQKLLSAALVLASFILIALPAGAATVTPFTEGRRTVTGLGESVSGHSAHASNGDIGVFDTGSFDGDGGRLFVGRVVGTGSDTWVFEALSPFAIKLDFFGISSRGGRGPFGARFILTGDEGTVFDTALSNRLDDLTNLELAAVTDPGRYELKVQSLSGISDYDVRVVPLPASLPLFLAALGLTGFLSRRRRSASA